MPSKNMMSQGPLVVRLGMVKYSPTPGMTLKLTPGRSGSGAMPVTYARASARCGAPYGERMASRSNSPAISPLPAATITRSDSAA